MYRPLLLLTCLLITLASGCSIDDQLDRREERLQGTWVLERATFDGDGDLFNDNVTDEFEGDQITFFRNGRVEYLAGNGAFFAGTWFLDAVRDLEDDIEFTMDADFFDDNGQLAFRWLGTVKRLTNNNFNINVAEVDGVLRLRWDKI